jgi:hypothetical protein
VRAAKTLSAVVTSPPAAITASLALAAAAKRSLVEALELEIFSGSADAIVPRAAGVVFFTRTVA